MESLTEILCTEADRAYFTALRVTGDPSLAEEAVQEACLRLLRSPVPDMAPGQCRAYLLRTVHSAAVDLLKSDMARRRREEAVNMRGDRAAPSPASEMVAAETARAAREALSALPDELRLPVSLCCEQALSHREAAEVLCVPEKTVTDRVHRGLERLRQVMIAAGHAGCAPAGLAAGLGALGVPAAPTGLVAKLQALAAGAKGAGAVESSTAASAAKGGFTVKIVAGVILAGALAGASVAMFPGKPGVLPAEGTAASTPPSGTAAPAGERVYTCEQLLRVGFAPSYCEWVWAGPRTSSYNYKFEGLAVDDAGNVYGAVKGQVGRGGHEGGLAYECVIMKYDPKTERVTRLAGGARGGALDGPGETAQLDYQFYNSGGLRIDSKRGYLYLTDNVNGVIRRISTKDGRVTTIAPDLKPAVSVAVDQEGVVYVHVPFTAKSGLYRLTPEGEAGKETYKVERVGEKAIGSFLAADARRGKVYASGRGGDISTIEVWDLKAGGGAAVKPVPIAKPNGNKAQCYESDGPLEGAVFWCPVNLNISPDGRYLYLGGGDEDTFRRIDVDGRRICSLYRQKDESFTWKERKEKQYVFWGLTWPSACCEAEDGTFYSGSSAHGLYKLTPVGRQ